MRAFAVGARGAWLSLLAAPLGCAPGAPPASVANVARPPRAEKSVRVASACPHDAMAAGDTCRCVPGLSLLEGACVGPREVEAYCGAPLRGAEVAPVCPVPACREGEPLDLASGECVPARVARAAMARVRPVPDDLAPACHDGEVLVARGDRDREVACLPSAATCPRTSGWDPVTARCAPLAPCPPGEVREHAECVPVVVGARGRGALVDVGRWVRAMIGADRGSGTARLCQPFTAQPWAFDVGTGGARALELAIELRFPDNDVTQVSGRVAMTDAASGQPIFGHGTGAGAGNGWAQGENALEALLVPLRALGGTADAASATLQVTCTIHGGSTPILAPLTPREAR